MRGLFQNEIWMQNENKLNPLQKTSSTIDTRLVNRTDYGSSFESLARTYTDYRRPSVRPSACPSYTASNFAKGYKKTNSTNPNKNETFNQVDM